MGIDGATWVLIAPLVSKGALPNFSRLVADGFTAVLDSTIPAISPAAWTSIFTGVNPGKHGIVDFYLREKGGFVSCMSRYRTCKTIWDILSELGRRCIVINDPVTFPPQKINGIMTTGLLTPYDSNNWIYPENLRNELDIVAQGYETDVPNNFQRVLNDKTAALGILANLAKKTLRLSKYTATKVEWDVLAPIYTTTDRLQHYYWHDPEAILSHYQVIDRILGEHLKLAQSVGADLIVVSDHGFGPINWTFPINEWLEQNQLARVTRGGSLISRFLAATHVMDVAAKIFGSYFGALPPRWQDIVRKYVGSGGGSKGIPVDLGKSQAYAMSAAGIFVNDETLIPSITEKLLHVIHEDTGKKIFERIVPREEAMHGEYVSRAPHLFLIPNVGFVVETKRGQFNLNTGNHRPEGIFVHYRPGSRASVGRGVVVKTWDVAATILSLQDVPIPTYFDGEPRLGEFTTATV